MMVAQPAMVAWSSEEFAYNHGDSLMKHRNHGWLRYACRAISFLEGYGYVLCR